MALQKKLEENFILQQKILYSLIINADSEGKVDFNASEIAEIFGFDINDYDLELFLTKLADKEILALNSGGEDGFAINFFVTVTEKTKEYFYSKGFDKIENELAIITKKMGIEEKEKNKILSFNPRKLSNEIVDAEKDAAKIQNAIKKNQLLKGLSTPISNFQQYLQDVKKVNDNYSQVYTNIIKPIQVESESGVKATVRWAIISIIASTLISLIIQNYSYFESTWFRKI